jgi:GH25 family lysozyme M1 (1,4-beta-N-acetylmuramidase)
MANYIWPWPKGTRASQEFGAFPGGVNPAGGHTGLDAALPAGTPLRAPADGIVTFEGWANINNNPYWLTDGGGICGAIDFGDGRPATIMGHLSATFVSKGDRVKQGQIVWESGNTGKWTTGPHVHLEFLPPVYKMDGSPTYGRVNPRNYCDAYWEDIQAPPVSILLPYQRETATFVRERNVPNHEGSLIIKEWGPELVFDFKGYVLGSDPFGDGNRVWFQSKHRDTFYHSSAFKDMDTHDLPNLTPVGTVPQPKPEPLPVLNALHGVDISNHQKDIDIRALGGDFIAIKATEGDGYLDPFFELNERKSRDLGLIRKFYHFARPDLGNTAEAELRWFLSVVGPKLRLGDILVLDWEAGDETHLGHVEWVDIFLTGAQNAHGGSPILYAGHNAIQAAGERWKPVEERFALWYPAYPINDVINGFHPEQAGIRPPVIWNGKPMLIWQYTAKGRLPGYGGDLDLNVAYCTKDELAAHGVTRLTAPAPEPKPEPEPTPVALPSIDQPISVLVDLYNRSK